MFSKLSAGTTPAAPGTNNTSKFFTSGKGESNLKEIFKLIIQYSQELVQSNWSFENLHKKFRGGRELRNLMMKNTPVMVDFAIYGLLIYIKMKIDYLKNNSKNKPSKMVLDDLTPSPPTLDSKLSNSSNTTKKGGTKFYNTNIPTGNLGLLGTIKSNVLNDKGTEIFGVMHQVMNAGDKLGSASQTNKIISSEFHGLSDINMKAEVSNSINEPNIEIKLSFTEQDDIGKRIDDKNIIDKSIQEAIKEKANTFFSIDGKNVGLKTVLPDDKMNKKYLITLGLYGFYIDDIIKQYELRSTKNKQQVRTSQRYVNRKVRVNKKSRITYVQKINKSLNTRK